MITSKDVRNKRFEKAAFGYKQEEIDEFLSQLEAELDEMERERAEANNKIQILADKVREYMKDEDALKDALKEAQNQVSEFKKSLFDMYKSHLELISSMPETFEDAVGYEPETAEEIAASIAAE